MASVLMGLGPFYFSMDTVGYHELERITEPRRATHNRIGRAPAKQFLGPGEDKFVITATLLTEHFGPSGLNMVDAMREASNEGEPFWLASGFGRIFGEFLICGVRARHSHFTRQGAPRVSEVQIELEAYGEDEGGPGGGF